ncbi:MAG: hypothetical protein JNN12_15580 [Bacteroidetes Order II. Incertae sedis bacterium]|nr:hypothetical protein [Bacteroidetes Order II. bacterium]
MKLLTILFLSLSAILCRAQIAPQALKSKPELEKEEALLEDVLEDPAQGDSPKMEERDKKPGRKAVLATLPDAKNYFGGETGAAVDNVSFSLSKNGATLFAEFLSDYLFLGKTLGYGRIGFGALVNTGQDSTKTTMAQFLSGGGNGMMYLYVPIVTKSAFHERYEMARVSLVFLPRVGLDIPALNAAITNPGYNADIGFEAQGLLLSVSKTFQFFAQTRLSAVLGSDDFYRHLGLTSKQFHPFVSGRWTFGVDLNSLIRISVTNAFLEPKRSQQSPVILSVQLINRRR